MDHSAPLISIITVCYNSEAHVEHALRSVDEQTWPHREHLVIDGASTDATLRIVDAHRRQWRHVVSEPDRGIYDAMNKGVNLATGDVIGFLNSDDYYAHDQVLAHVEQTFRSGRFEAMFGDVAFFRPEHPERIVRRYRAHHFKPARLAWGWMPPHPALFVRRDVFRRVGPFRTDMRIAGDFDWIVRAFWKAGIYYRHLPEILVHMRTGGVSTAGWRNTLLLNREVIRACRENGLATNWPKVLSKYPAKVLEFVRP